MTHTHATHDRDKASIDAAAMAETLIARYIEPDPVRPGVTEARVKQRAVAVWAVIGRYLLTPGDDAVADVARAYNIAPAAAEAALAYYRRHQPELDRRLAELDVA